MWKNALGRRRSIKKIGHQHLSNIFWFKTVFNGSTRQNDHVMGYIEDEINTRFNGKRLPWKPLPIPNEINWLYKMDLINENKDIIFKGKKIGTIKHIK